MERKHKGRFYPDPNLRAIQEQIDELWEVVVPLMPTIVPRGTVVPENMRPGAIVRIDHDALAEQVVAEVEEALRSDPVEVLAEMTDALKPGGRGYGIEHTGRGWYRVVDADGKPLEGDNRKLRKEPAWQEAVELQEKAVQTVG